MTKVQLLKVIQEIRECNISTDSHELIHSLFFSYSTDIDYSINFILVLAGKRLNRVKTAVDFYHKNRTKIILSGGVFNSNCEKECERYFDYCIKHGVLKEDIILEQRSTNTYQNLLYSLELIQNMWFSSCHILIISSLQHLPRVDLTLKKIQKEIPFSVTYQCYPSITTLFNENNWYLQKESREEIVAELEKIIRYHLIEL